MQLSRKLKVLAEELEATPVHVGSGLWVALVRYTPEKATLLLEHRNPSNRKPGNTDALTADMLAGRFVMTGETAIFDEDANILSCQRRLSAIQRSGKAQDILTVFGVNREEAFPVLDHGKKRNLADSLFMDKQERKNLTLLAGTLRICWAIVNLPAANFGMSNDVKGIPQTEAPLLQFLADHPDIEDAVHFCMSEAYCPALKYQGGFSAALFWATSRIDRNKAREMFSGMANGTMMMEPKWSSPRKFVKRLNESDEMGKLGRIVYRALLVKVWGNFFNEEAPERLLWTQSKEDFPLIEGLSYKDDKPDDKRLAPLKAGVQIAQ